MKKNFYSSWEKKLRKLLLSLTLLFGFLTSAQNIGDYGAIASGNWDSAIWGVWDGSAFVGPATTLPAGGTTKDVYIPAGISVNGPITVYTSPNIGNLYIMGKLYLNNNFTFTNTTHKISIVGGLLKYNSQLRFTLQDPNAIFTVSGYDGTTQTGIQGSSCNNNDELFIGTQTFAVCNGLGNKYDFLFRDLNTLGSPEAVPTVSPTAGCLGTTISFYGTYRGFVGTAPTYSWDIKNASNVSVFTSTTQGTSTAPVTYTPTAAGTYTVSLTVKTNGLNTGILYQNTQSVTVTIYPLSVGGTASPNQTICSGTQPGSALTLTGNTGAIQWQKSTDNVNFTDISGATANTLPAATMGTLLATTYYRAKVTSGTCSPAYSSIVTITVENPTITGPASVPLGSTITLTGSPAPATTAPWTSSNITVATITSSGVVTPIALGTTTITYKTQTGCTVSKLITVTQSVCYEDPTLATSTAPAKDSKFGITALGRAGAQNGNWPMVRKGAYMVLEAKTKGFVITRVESTSKILNPIEGMIVYDKSKDCLSIFNGATWNCYQTQTCP